MPFREIHEIYRIVLLRAEAQAKAEKEREETEKKQKEEQEAAERARKGLPPLLKKLPSDVKVEQQKKQQDKKSQLPSLNAEMLEDVFEELADGGV